MRLSHPATSCVRADVGVRFTARTVDFFHKGERIAAHQAQAHHGWLVTLIRWRAMASIG
jgi:hypothetical protein